jgi:1-acyl-sn-glycerol-3-phosphate acyltransferase
MPVALRTDFFGIGKIVRDFGPLDRSKPILFRVGPPIPVEGTGKEAHARVVSFIAENLSAWGTPVE